MNKENNATEASTPAIAPEETAVSVDDAETRLKQLETEKENYRQAYLKEVDRNRVARTEGIISEDEERMTNIARKVLTDSQISGLDSEREALLTKALKENKELKLAHLNKTGIPASMGSSTETIGVKDTLITPDQMASFKAKGWDDKTIERYKKNYLKAGGR